MPFVAALISGVLAYSEYREEIPNGKAVLGCDGQLWDAAGHFERQGGGARNPFGEAFAEV